MAAHTRRESAVKKAVLELCEREALMISWSSGIQLPRIDDISLDPSARALMAEFRACGYEPLLCDVTLDLVPVVLLMGFDTTGAGRVLLKGSAADEDPTDAIRRALLEAHAGLRFNVEQPYELPAAARVTTPRGHLSFYSRPDRAARLYSWLADGPTRSMEQVADVDVWAALDRAGLCPTVCDLDPHHRYGNVSVIRALVPGMVPFAYGAVDPDPQSMRATLVAELTKRPPGIRGKVGSRSLHPFG
jgi:ribosomal protein S12 methylthiotransferase accessory factor YcaO